MIYVVSFARKEILKTTVSFSCFRNLTRNFVGKKTKQISLDKFWFMYVDGYGSNNSRQQYQAHLDLFWGGGGVLNE